MKYKKYSLVYLSSFLLTIYFGLFHSRLAHAGVESQIGKQIARQLPRFIANPTTLVGTFIGILVLLWIEL